MNIKTITTTEGVNEVDFGSNASRFYWFQNLGTTTVHVSGKDDITAGSDGVAELAAGDSVCIETLSGKVYVLGAGKVQIHNTGDKFCPFKNAPVAGGGGGNSYTKSESDAKYAQKTDIPSSLPANGGNADTVDGYHVNDYHHADGSIPPNYFTEFLRINDDTKSIERWSTDNLKVAFAKNATNAENADTVGGLHANDFSQIVDFGGSETDTKTAIGKSGKTTIYRCTKWTDYPAEFIDSQGVIITVNYNGSGTVGTDFIWCTQIIVNPRSGNKMFIRYIDAMSVSDWKEISTTPIKSTTFSGTTDAYSNIALWAKSENKIPILFECENKNATVFYGKSSNFYAYVTDNLHQNVVETAVSGTVWYVEV